MSINKPATSAERLGDVLSGEEYLRQRLQPKCGDFSYLNFLDMLTVIRPFAGQLKPGSRVFDYGCGGAPYESLFSHCAEYVRADLVPGPKVQIPLRPDGLSDEPAQSYDGVMSTQVMEHVPDPLAYLLEVRRILRPGGQALITTHGMFEEHGCPHDYQRWTIAGFERLALEAGFEIVETHKLTTQIRGSVQLLHYLVETLRLPGRRTPLWYGLDLTRRIHRRAVRPVLNWLAHQFDGQGVVPGNDPAAVYVGISARLRKPPQEN